MSLVLTLKGNTSVISVILSYIEREESSKTQVNAAEVVFSMKVCFSAAK